MKEEPFGREKVSDAWFRGIASRVNAEPASRSQSQIVSALSAYHEFEQTKLQIAVQSKNYNHKKHMNDLLDAEQLIYLWDLKLGFLTCDAGFKRVKTSPQAARIITVLPEDLAGIGKVGAFLRKVLQSAGTANTI